MKNNVYTKTTWVIHDYGSYLVFEFYDAERKLLGSVDVSDRGKVIWDIIDLNYLDNIMELINFIMQDNNSLRLHYETKDENIERWKNACIYIEIHSIVVNRKFNYVNNIENTNGYIR